MKELIKLVDCWHNANISTFNISSFIHSFPHTQLLMFLFKVLLLKWSLPSSFRQLLLRDVRKNECDSTWPQVLSLALILVLTIPSCIPRERNVNLIKLIDEFNKCNINGCLSLDNWNVWLLKRLMPKISWHNRCPWDDSFHRANKKNSSFSLHKIFSHNSVNK